MVYAIRYFYFCLFTFAFLRRLLKFQNTIANGDSITKNHVPAKAGINTKNSKLTKAPSAALGLRSRPKIPAREKLLRCILKNAKITPKTG